ncbi:hypothetical protein AMTR_s00030p00157260, partial [Amborella trichopoda]
MRALRTRELHYEALSLLLATISSRDYKCSASSLSTFQPLYLLILSSKLVVALDISRKQHPKKNPTQDDSGLGHFGLL